MSVWSYNTPVDQPGSTVSGSGMVRWRDSLDATRAGQGNRIPQAEYPDGYLGNVGGRQQDKLLNSLKNRLTDRSYQRGVHKGERVDPGDYFWPPEFNPNTRLIQQAQSTARWAPTGNPVEHLTFGGKPGPQDLERMRKQYGINPPAVVAQIDPNRATQMGKLLPRWK